MDFVRFTGELGIYFTLLALGGAVLVGLTFAVLSIVGIDPEPVLGEWILPFAVPGAFVVAAWLVEAKQDIVENIAPVLTRVFTPLTIAMLVDGFDPRAGPVPAALLDFRARRRPFAALEHWQTRCLPVYGAWALIVVGVFPPVFAFA